MSCAHGHWKFSFAAKEKVTGRLATFRSSERKGDCLEIAKVK